MDYKDLQIQVFDWLKNKSDQDSTFTFSVRRKANKGNELNYFIGTEKSKYFSTTFWSIPVAYPGSAGDLISLIFNLRSKLGLEFSIEFNQTRKPHDNQNKFALQLIRNCKPRIFQLFPETYSGSDKNKMENYEVCSPTKYNSFEDSVPDLEKILNKVIPIVNEEIANLKTLHPEFTAYCITRVEQETMLEKMDERFDKFKADLGSNSKYTEKEDNIEIEISSEKENVQVSKSPFNQILFGPPGTGKTYNTINKAISIANPDFDLKQDRKLIKLEYQRLVDEGRIVFTTFHQSMSYEDFIEGIKPLKPESDDAFVKYDIQDGLFKLIAKNSIKEYYVIENNKKGIDRNFLFDTAWANLILEANTRIENGKSFFLKTYSKKDMEIISLSNHGNILVRPKVENGLTYTISYSRTEKLFNAFETLENIQNIDKEFRKVINGANSTAYWAVINYLNIWIKENKSLTKKDESIHLNNLKFSNKIIKNENSNVPNYVIIIDEINRGNISQIFGELITLIEDDKRLGKSEALEITLPYSKEKFGVPPNLYIIGTMNTADRSVESLDNALRRRFSFEEMPPKYDLEALDFEIAEIPASVILRTINLRIEKLLDKDHAIGHAYFIGKNQNSIIDSFYKNIIPLLQEYFFGDYGKIGLVLGSGFVSLKQDEGAELFASFDYENGTDYLDRNSYEILDYRKDSDNEGFENAIRKLMNVKVSMLQNLEIG